MMAQEDTTLPKARRMLLCFRPSLLSVCPHRSPSPKLFCEPIALSPRYLHGCVPPILEQRNCAHEDEWIESLRVMGFLHRFFFFETMKGNHFTKLVRRGLQNAPTTATQPGSQAQLAVVALNLVRQRDGPIGTTRPPQLQQRGSKRASSRAPQQRQPTEPPSLPHPFPHRLRLASGLGSRQETNKSQSLR